MPWKTDGSWERRSRSRVQEEPWLLLVLYSSSCRFLSCRRNSLTSWLWSLFRSFCHRSYVGGIYSRVLRDAFEIQNLFEIIRHNPHIAHHVQFLNLERASSSEWSRRFIDCKRSNFYGQDISFKNDYDQVMLKNPQPLMDLPFINSIAPS